MEEMLMTGRRLGAAWSVILAVVLAGCSSSVGLYHDIEGGAIAQYRQPPPGADLPYPNLANVPAAPALSTAISATSVNHKLHNTTPDVSPPSPGALAGLELPTAPPPNPDIPGLQLPSTPSTPVIPPKIAAAPPPKPEDSAPVAMAFPPNSAVLSSLNAPALQSIASGRGNASILVGGFGDDISLALALARAQRLADALTANGVPPASIRLLAAQSGSGGFVQLVY
jgi:outer membrane protein OmpA-like peptidoglycan-associated protein